MLGTQPGPAREDGTTVIAKAESGYYGCRRDGDFLLIDCGPVGPEYQPGHAHCDTLSFELSLDGRRVVVDSGVHGYETDALRAYVRSTAAHNTVKVNGVEQSEIWGAFRVGRRARPLMARIERLGDDDVAFTGAHDGYRHLGQRVIHERHVRCRPASGVYEFEDRLTGTGEASAESYLHLHPELSVETVDGRYRVAGSDGRPVMDIVPGDMSASEIGKGVYCPRFGVGLENMVVVLKNRGRLPFKISFSLKKIAS